MVYPGARLRTALAGKYIRELVDWHPDVVHSQCEFSTFFLARRIAEELAFAVARNCGKPLLSLLFLEKTIQRYSHWTEEKDRFARLFALAIFLPVAPDDFLCYLAGTTEMSWGRYTAIILLCKPFAIALYSLGLTLVWNALV